MKIKKLLNLKKRNRREPRANAFTVESLEPRLLLSAAPMIAAVVITDHQDYAPGETAVITTSNTNGDGLQFDAGEMVSFQVTRTDGMADAASQTAGVGPAGNEAWYVTDGMGGFTAHLGSDVSGDGVADWIAPDNDLMVNSSISTTWYVEEQYRNSSLLVTAAGQESGAMASQAFTDANLNTSTVVTASSATSTYGDDVTFTATVTPSAGGTTRPVGTVEFFDNGVTIGVTASANLGAGLSSTFAITRSEGINFSQLAAGSHSITAVFTGGANITDSFNNSTSGAINHTVSQKNVTATFGAESRVYDGTTAAFVLFADINGVVGLDEVALAGGTATFDNANAGLDKTVTLTGASLFGAAAGNYNLTSVATALADIDKAEANITVNGFVGAFDGQPHGATGTATGVLGEDLSPGLNLGGTFTTVGTHVANWTFSGGINYNDNPAARVDIVINAAPTVGTSTVISSSTAASTYGDTVTLTATVTALSGAVAPTGTVQFFDGATSLGIGTFNNSVGLDSIFTLDVATLNAVNHTAIHAVFTATATFITSTSGNTTVNVSKANAIVTGFSGIYDGAAHGAIATGVLGEDLSAGLVSDTFINFPGGTASWTYTDSTGNYENASSAVAGTVEIVINKANVTPVDYSGIYDGAAHGATLVGVLGEIVFSGPTHRNVGLFTDAINFIGGAGNYNDFSGDVVTSISAKDITGSFIANNKAYDGTTDATVQNTSLLGVILGDDVTLDGGTASFDTKDVGINKTVTLADAILSGADAGNYNLTSVNTTTASITAKAITGSFTANNKVYDGTTAASVASTSLSGVVAGDVGAVSLTGGTATFADKNVGINKTVTLTGAILSGAASGNYTLTSVATDQANITALGITGNFTAANKVYDGTAVAGVVTRTLTGAIVTDTVSLTGGTAAFADANVANGKVVTLTGAILSGADSTNYSLTSVNTTTANITARGITGSFTAESREYDGTTVANVLATDLAGVLAGDVSDVILLGSTATFDTKNVGLDKTVTLTGATLVGAAAGNYSLLSVDTTIADISALGITGSFTAVSKVYDGSTLAGVAVTSLAGAITGDDVILDFLQADFDTKNVGTGKIVTLTGATLTGLDAGNYSLTSIDTATADITAAGLTGSFTVDSKVYDGTDIADLLSVIAGLDGGIFEADDVFLDYDLLTATVTFDNANAGIGKTVTLTGAFLNGADAGNYTLTMSTGTADITALGITGDFTAANKVYNGTTAATVQTRTLTGVIGADAVSLTGGTATFADANAGTGKIVTLTGATLTGAASGNYSLTSVNTTTANITALGITGNFTAANKVFDGTTSATVQTRTLTGVIGADAVSLTGGTATFADANAGIGKIVTLTGAALTGAASGNYSLASVNTTTANITALGIVTGNFTVANKVYDGNTSATVLSRTLTGVLAGDVANVSLIGGTATFANANAGTGKIVTLTGATLTGAASGNYSLASVNTTTANITALGITGNFTAANKVYNGTTAATVQTRTLTGVIGADVVSLTGGTATFNNANVGIGKTVTLTGATLAGAGSGNYSLTSVNTTTANITALGITGNFTAANKVYNGTTAATVQTRTLTGVIGADVVSLTGGTATFNNANVGIGKTVTLTGATLAGAGSGNYSLTSVNTTTANITALGLTGNFTAANKVYDGTTAATVQTRTLTGVIGADAVSLTGGTATFDNADAGTGKTVTLTGATLTGAASGNYSLTSVNQTTADIAKADATIVVSGFNGVYDAAAHGATGSATGIGGVNLSAGLSLGASFTNAPGGTANWTFSGGTNYNDTDGSVAIVIAQAQATVTITGNGLNGSGYYGTYDGQAHAATATVTGVGGVVLGQLVSSTTHTNVGIYSDTVTFLGDANYQAASKVVKSYILLASVTITGNGLNGSGYYGTYDGAAHAATATVRGVGGVVLGQLVSSTPHTNVGIYSDTVTFLGDANYKAASKVVKSYITQATVTITGNGLNGSGYYGTYDAQAHAATATVTGVGGVVLGQVTSSTTHTNVGVYSDTVTFAGDTNYKACSKVVKSYITAGVGDDHRERAERERLLRNLRWAGPYCHGDGDGGRRRGPWTAREQHVPHERRHLQRYGDVPRRRQLQGDQQGGEELHHCLGQYDDRRSRFAA